METTPVTVWILVAGYDYEGYDILGVFATEQLAENHKENIKKEIAGHDYVNIKPHTLVSR